MQVPLPGEVAVALSHARRPLPAEAPDLLCGFSARRWRPIGSPVSRVWDVPHLL